MKRAPLPLLRLAVLMVAFLAAAALASAQSGEWRPLPMGRGEYRLEPGAEPGEALVWVRPFGLDENHADDALVVALPPPAKGKKALLELRSYTARNRWTGERRTVTDGKPIKPDDTDLGGFDRQVRRTYRLTGEGWMGPVYVVCMNVEYFPAPHTYEIEEAQVSLRVVPDPEIPPAPLTLDAATRAWIEATVANPESVADLARRGRPAIDPAEADWAFHTRADVAWRYTDIDAEGLYVLRPAFLAQAGLSGAAADPATLRLWRDGREVPTLLRDGAVYFAGFPSDDRHTRVARYWIEPASAEPPLRMETAAPLPEGATPTVLDGSQQTLHLNRDELVVTRRDRFLTILDFRWVERALPPDAAVTSRFDLPGLAPQIGSPTLKLTLFATGPLVSRNVTLAATLNGKPLAPASLSLEGSGEVELALNGAPLRPSDNQLELTAGYTAQEGFLLHLDEILVTYTRDHFANVSPFRLELAESSNVPNRQLVVDGLDTGAPIFAFDLADPLAPRTIPVTVEGASGRAVLTPSPGQACSLFVAGEADTRAPAALVVPTRNPALRQGPGGPCDLLIVAHESLLEPARELAALHAKRGAKALVVAAGDVALEFGRGPLTPPALRRFLAHAAVAWPLPPAAVLLMGDCSQDFRGDFRNGVANLIPSWRESPGGPARAGYASDYPYACLVGEDLVPDVPLARISASSVEDARALVEKLASHAATAAPGEWKGRMAIVADSGEFGAEAEFLARHRAPSFMATTLIRLGSLPWVDNFLFSREELKTTRSKISPAGTTAIRRAFEDGLFALLYLGHGSPNIWSDERLWFGGGSPNSDNLLLRNAPALPFVANFTCNTGAIDYPLPPWNVCITEDMLRQRQGGALAVLAPGGLGTMADHRRMAEEVLRALYGGAPATVGAVTTAARARFALRDFDDDMLRMYIVQGDPLTELRRVAESLRVSLADGGRYAAPGTPLAVRLAGPAGFAGATVTLSVRDPAHAERYRGQVTLPASGAWSGELPLALDREGSWRLHAYASGSTGAEALGGSVVEVGRPRLEVDRLTVDRQPGGTGQPAALRARLLNKGALPVVARAVSLESWQPGDDAGAWTQRAVRLVSLKPGEGCDLAWEVAAPGPLAAWRVAVAGQAPAVEFGVPRAAGSASQRTAVTLVADGETSAPPRIVPLMALCGGLDPPRRGQNRWGLEAWAALVRGDAAALPQGVTGAALILESATGEQVARQEYPLERFGAAEPISGVMLLESGWTPRDESAVLRTEWLLDPARAEDGVTSLTIERPTPPTTIALPAAALPRLRLAGIRVLDPSPTEGGTVMVEADVENAGTADVHEVELALYELTGDAKTRAAGAIAAAGGGVPRVEELRPSPADFGQQLVAAGGRGGPETRAARLAPGEVATVSARWDPYEPAGPYVGGVRAMCQGDAVMPLPERETGAFAVRFRRQFELHFSGSPTVRMTPLDPRERTVRLEATIANRGETEVQRVEVRFYAGNDAREQGAEPVLIQEIAQIGPGSEATVGGVWQLTPEQARDGVRPAVQAAVKGSRQRISGAAD